MPLVHENSLFRQETERLQRSWDRHPREYLDTYLVSDVEDPRINFQSILTRALIIDTLFPGKFDSLIDAEWRFGLCLTWILQCLHEGRLRSELLGLLGARDPSRCPEFVIATHDFLQESNCSLPDYLSDALVIVPPDGANLIADPVLDTFASLWRGALAAYPGAGLSIVEPACGSANDYRYLAHFGMARFLDYAGFDLSRKNIENARARFPGVNFLVGNVLHIPADDGAFDFLFVHDLFEHLSAQGLERSLHEVLRVTRKEAWLSFFRLDSLPEHRFNIVEEYHVNTLSLERTVQSILRHASGIEVVDVPELVQRKFGYAGYHNAQAKTLIVTL